MAIPFLAGSLFSTWELQGAIILFQNHAGGGPVTGSFALSMQIMIILSGLFISITIAAMPALSRSAKRGDQKDLLFLDTFIRALFLLCAAVAIAGVVLGPILIPLIFGERYMLTAQLIGPALWCLLPFSVAATLTVFTIARGHYYISPACHLSGVAVLTLSMSTLVDQLGPLGGIVSAGLGMSTSSVCLIIIALIRNWIVAGKTLIYPLLCVASMLATYALLAPVSIWLAFTACLLVLFVLALKLSVISAADRRLVRKLLSRSS
jgi:O-antigen/teichoic acid export membrane protein